MFDRVGVGRIGGRRQAVGDAGDPDDVGRVAAAGALGVIHVDGAAADRRQRVLHEAALVQRVGVELHLEVQVVGHAQAAIDRGRAWSPNPRAA